jgi:hypothetical protein
LDEPTLKKIRNKGTFLRKIDVKQYRTLKGCLKKQNPWCHNTIEVKDKFKRNPFIHCLNQMKNCEKE